MASADAPPRSIRSLFEAAEAKRRAIEASPDTNSPTYAAAVEETVSLYKQTLDSIAAAAVFSPNEGIEDVSTTDIPLLLAGFHLAETVQRTPARQLTERRAVLERAASAYQRFLDLVDAYGLVGGGAYGKLLERFRDDGDGFAVAGGDAAARRNAKIASFQAEKELRTKLEALRRNPRYLDSGDEELVRDLYLTEVTFALHTTFNSLDSMNRERALLADAPAPAPPPASIDGGVADPLSRTRETDHDPTLRLDRPFQGRLGAGGPLLSKEGKPLQPFTLLGTASDSRQELRRGVFRPGHNLPTMSIDEYLEEEKRRGNILKGGEQPKAQLDEDDVDAVDREMYKAREWDEFKDHNPKGSGNTLNMG